MTKWCRKKRIISTASFNFSNRSENLHRRLLALSSFILLYVMVFPSLIMLIVNTAFLYSLSGFPDAKPNTVANTVSVESPIASGEQSLSRYGMPENYAEVKYLLGAGTETGRHNSIWAGDYNNDSLVEVFVGNENGFIHAFRYLTGKLVPLGQPVHLGSAVSGLGVADIDMDGNKEVVASGEDGMLGIYRLVQGRLEAVWSSPLFSGQKVTAIAVGDIGNDSQPEIVIATDATDGRIHILSGFPPVLQCSSGPLGHDIWPVSVAPAGYPFRICAADGQGNVYLFNLQQLNLTLLYQPQAFTSPVRAASFPPYSTGVFYFGYASGNISSFSTMGPDLNGDNRFGRDDEIAVYNPPNGTNVYSLALGDVDGDGADEIVAGYSLGMCRVLDGSLILKYTTERLAGGVLGVSAVDIDTDGRLEIIFSTSVGQIIVADYDVAESAFKTVFVSPVFNPAAIAMPLVADGSSQEILLPFSRSTGSTTGASCMLGFLNMNYAAQGYPELMSFILSEVSGNGIIALASGNIFPEGGVAKSEIAFCYGQSSSGYAGVISSDGELLWLSSNVGSRLVSIALGDANGDGALDIAAADTTGKIFLFLNTGDNLALSWTSPVNGTEHYSLKFADTDSDNKYELFAWGVEGYLKVFEYGQNGVGTPPVMREVYSSAKIGTTSCYGMDVVEWQGRWMVGVQSGSKVYLFNLSWSGDALNLTSSNTLDFGSTLTSLSLYDIDTDGRLEAVTGSTSGYLRVKAVNEVEMKWESPFLGKNAGRYQNLICTDFNNDTKHDIIVRTDGYIYLISVNHYENSPPIINIYSPLNFTPVIREGQSLRFEISAYDPEGRTVVAEMKQGNTLLATSTGRTAYINFTYNTTYTSAGNYIITLSVSDGVLLSTREWFLTVNDVNRLPEIISISPAISERNLVENSSLTLSVSASDPDGDIIHYLWTVDGAAAGSDKAAFTFYSIGLSLGPHVVEVNVYDISPVTGQTVSWTITIIKRVSVEVSDAAPVYLEPSSTGTLTFNITNKGSTPEDFVLKLEPHGLTASIKGSTRISLNPQEMKQADVSVTLPDTLKEGTSVTISLKAVHFENGAETLHEDSGIGIIYVVEKKEDESTFLSPLAWAVIIVLIILIGILLIIILIRNAVLKAREKHLEEEKRRLELERASLRYSPLRRDAGDAGSEKDEPLENEIETEASLPDTGPQGVSSAVQELDTEKEAAMSLNSGANTAGSQSEAPSGKVKKGKMPPDYSKDGPSAKRK